MNLRTYKPRHCIISSVVPEIDKIFRAAIRRTFNIDPIFVNYKNAGIKIGCGHSKEIGADRLVDAVAAWKKYRTACIIVDLGTATTLDYVDKKGVYWSGAIAPGIGVVNNALYNATSKLPRIKIKPVKRMIPNSTVEAIQIGIFEGYIGLIERLIKKTIKEVGGRPKVIATGGFAKLIAKKINTIQKTEPDITLEGLRIIHELIFTPDS